MIPTKKKEKIGTSPSEIPSRDSRQQGRPPKSKTRLDPDRNQRISTPKDKPSRNRSNSSDKKSPRYERPTLKSKDMNRESPPRRFPFDIPKYSDKTEWELYSPYLDRYGGQYQPADKASRYSPSKNPFVNYPPVGDNRTSRPVEDRYQDDYDNSPSSHKKPKKVERKDCLYCVDHEKYLGHAPHGAKKPSHLGPHAGDSRTKRGPMTFAPNEELYFEGKLYPISNSNSPNKAFY